MDGELLDNDIATVTLNCTNASDLNSLDGSNGFSDVATSESVSVSSATVGASLMKTDSGRINPFGDDIVMDEDHFVYNITQEGSSFTGFDNIFGSLDSNIADAPLTEEHFLDDIGKHLGDLTVTELQSLIGDLKRRIVELSFNIEAQQPLISRLVFLRFRLQQQLESINNKDPGSNSHSSNDAVAVPSACTRKDKDIKQSLNHIFLKQSSGSYHLSARHVDAIRHIVGEDSCLVSHIVKRQALLVALSKDDKLSSTDYFPTPVCEVCRKSIATSVLFQSWFWCALCDFCCHSKCLNRVTRRCIAQKVLEQPKYILDICPEKGLVSQGFRCADCRTNFDASILNSLTKRSQELLLCDYTGLYFCSSCHWGDVGVNPARVLRNWDWRPVKMSRLAVQILRLLQPKPLLKVHQINPLLFSFLEELDEIKRLREDIIAMKSYFVQCHLALQRKLLLRLQHRQHFVETSELYSFQDLIDIHKDSLIPELLKIHSSFAQHIKTECPVCKIKGQMCPYCDMPENLFPFDSIVHICANSECRQIMHRHCFLKQNKQCASCLHGRSEADTDPSLSSNSPVQAAANS